MCLHIFFVFRLALFDAFLALQRLHKETVSIICKGLTAPSNSSCSGDAVFCLIEKPDKKKGLSVYIHVKLHGEIYFPKIWMSA